ncbi:TPA: hypothetical protein U1C40_000086 [Streptococcus suis]|nr:hypothetical protein [Streptococcus suis]
MKEVMKGKMIYIIMVGILLCFAVLGIYNSLTRTNKGSTPPTEQPHTPPSAVEEAISETADEKNYRTAKLKLERPYASAPAEQQAQVAQAMDKAITAIQSAPSLSEMNGTIENHLSMSQEAMVQTLAMAIRVNQYQYQSSQLEVSPSENEDVVQFLMVLTKEGEENCYMVGNFNTTVRQIQLKAYVGGIIGGTFG